MMTFKNKITLSSIISLNDNEIKINSNDEDLIEKIKKIESIIKNKLNKEWSEKDYLIFLKQFSKLEIDEFKSLYNEITFLLELELEETEEVIKYINDKLNLGIFNDKRKTKPIKITRIENDKEVECNSTVISFVPHTFTTADIILFFQAINSKINKYNCIIMNKFDQDYNACTFIKKEEILKTMIENYDNNQSLNEMLEIPYFTWINNIDKNTFIYPYLEERISYIKTQNLNRLRAKLLDFEKRSELSRYKRKQHDDYLVGMAKYNQKTKNMKNKYRY